jgi:large repetitive protein
MREMKNCLMKMGILLLLAVMANSLWANPKPKSSKTTFRVVLTKPVAIDDSLSADAKTLLKFNPTTNDIVNGTLSALTIIESPRNGSIGFTALDTLIYMPNDGFCGKDTLFYQICNERFECDTAMIEIAVSCLGQNGDTSLVPATKDDIAITFMNTSVDINVLANDSLRSVLVRPLSISGQPHNGLAWVSNNRVIYLPNSLFCGKDTLMYAVCNAAGCDTSWVFITVECRAGDNTNRNKPIALNDTFSIARNGFLFMQPLKNDTINGTLAGMSIVKEAKHGSILFSSIDSLVYIPQMGYCGADTVSYRICNDLFLCDTATIYINIACTIDSTGGDLPPVAFDDVSSTPQGNQVGILVLANDNINAPLIKPITIVGDPNHGTAWIYLNEIIYKPDSAFCGETDTVSYEICNKNGCDVADVIISVGCVVIIRGQDVIAHDDKVTTDRSKIVEFRPTLNDTLNGVLLGVGIVSEPKNGSIGFLGIDTLIYVPNYRYCGKDTMSYSVCREDFKCDTAYVFFEVNCTPLGERPDVLNDVVTVVKNTATKINVTKNDASNGPIVLPLSIVGFPKHGTASFDAEGKIDYTPALDVCNVKDTLAYIMCNEYGCDTGYVYINIICENVLLPIANDDEAVSFKNTSVEKNVIANDILNGILETITITKQPTNGTASILNNNIIYAPNQDFCNAKDTVEYTICTKNGCATALFVIDISCENRFMKLPTARVDTVTTMQSRAIAIAILNNDSTYAYPLEDVYIIENVTHGVVTLDGGNNAIYIPIPSFCGDMDSFTYALCTVRGCDTTKVYINVDCDPAMSIAPIAVEDSVFTLRQQGVFIDILQNDSLYGADSVRIIRLAKRGTVALQANKKLFYQPDATFCGRLDSVSYAVCNVKGCDTATVRIAVGCDTTAQYEPVANFDVAKTDINRAVLIPIFRNDTLRGAIVTEVSVQPKNGLAMINGDSVAVYIPKGEFWGRDTFTYIICNLAGCDTAIVYLTVIAGKDIVVYNAFSPNGDNINDKFIIRGIDNYPNNEVAIYNRWGNEVFRRKGYNNDDPWNGLWDNNMLMDGTYFYIIHLNDDKKQKLSGYIQVHK